MSARNVSLTDELDRYVKQSVQSGHYDNASEVSRAAIRELKQSKEEDKAFSKSRFSTVVVYHWTNTRNTETL